MNWSDGIAKLAEVDPWLALVALLLLVNAFLSVRVQRDGRTEKKSSDGESIRAFIQGLHDGTRSRVDIVGRDVVVVQTQMTALGQALDSMSAHIAMARTDVKAVHLAVVERTGNRKA